MAGERLERAASKALLATELAVVGATIAGPAGAVIGATAGLIVGDSTLVFPLPMVAIPAHEYASVLAGNAPTTQIYINAGEVLTQVQPTEAQETEIAIAKAKPRKKRRKLNSWQRFLKTFQYRKRRNNEAAKVYGQARMKAAAKAYKRNKGGK